MGAAESVPELLPQAHLGDLNCSRDCFAGLPGVYLCTRGRERLPRVGGHCK